MGTPLEYIEVVVDLGGPLQWFDCFSGYNSSTYRPIYCGSSTCDVANAFGCNICGGDGFGCINGTCGPYLSNPFDQNILAGGILSEDTTSLSLTDGLRYLNDVLMRRLLFICANKNHLFGLGNGTRGVLGLSRSQAALPTQLSLAFNKSRKVALCIRRRFMLSFFLLRATSVSF
ncbi:hypothetical protein Pint_24901 [Pistacia integerrima]|uniref:Uncharacterized protein n=1 Tax=Pistacia integerrima TaxID=434235 RepID=A0ACC0YFX4_9ROSI|nr:hypothetical protein Pint_24901 [Pistacia integerrima]